MPSTTEGTNIGDIDSTKDRQGVLTSNGKPLVKKRKNKISLERRAFLEGLFRELNTQLQHHLHLVEEYARLQAQIMISERTLRLTREHLYIVLGKTEEAVPVDWRDVLAKVRFVGMRLGDACMELLKEHGSLTTDELRQHLDAGQFRFRSGFPLREINAALLRTPNANKKSGEDKWVYKVETEMERVG